MDTTWSSEKTFVRRLRVRASGGRIDATALQLRLARFLSTASLHPLWLAPSAVLCVRRLRGPAPGSLSARGTGLGASPAWERAVSASLGELARHAARPAQDFVPADAEAVLFADQAELLASFIGDCCAGSAVTQWWWQSLFRGADARPVPALLDAPTCIPAVFEHLALRGQAAAFARTLSGGEACALLASVMRIFDLPQLQAALDAAFNAPHHAADTGDAGGARAAPAINNSETAQGSVSRAPWHASVPECAWLALIQQTLLGVSLSLRRTPMLVRTQAFARATRRWLLEALVAAEAAPVIQTFAPAANPSLAPASHTTQTPSAEAQGETHADARLAALAHNILPAEVAGDASSTQSQALEFKPAQQSQISPAEATDGARALVSSDVHAPSRSERPTAQTRGAGDATEYPSAVDGQIEQPAPPRQTDESAPAPAAADDWCLRAVSVETELGGIFYLINLALFLELYGDFTTPATPGIALNPWDFLALAGVELIGDRFPADPLWALLARLAGRDVCEAPGKGYLPADEWRVPADWLRPFTEHAELIWTTHVGRLRLHHPADFLLLDLSLRRRNARALLARELKVYQSHFSYELHREITPARARAAQGKDRRARWLTRLMPYVRARLRRALGLAGERNLAEFLCARPARVHASATRVDVFFSLLDLPVEVRLSGIDRDPGWVPAAGRYIAFHYE